MITSNDALQTYIQTYILPQYARFDKAHDTNHVADVLATSLEIAQDYDVDLCMVYTIAAYHDIGLAQGREYHHLYSADILLQDTCLSRWFTPAQLRTMARAIIDHRASAQNPPQTLYGRIIGEADRQIDPTTILYRTRQYGNAHYPHLSPQEQFERGYAHIEEKYGDKGYLTLWLDTGKNVRGLQAVRDLLHNKAAFTVRWDSLQSLDDIH